MDTLSPAELFEALRQDLIEGIPTITGPVIATNDARATMLYRLAENDPIFVTDQGIFYPEDFSQRKRSYIDHPPLYRQVHEKFPYGETSDIFNGKTLVEPSFDSLEDYFLNFFLDRNFQLKLLNQGEIKKQHPKLEGDTSTIRSLFGIVSNGRVSFSFYCIGGFLSSKEIHSIYESQKYGNITAESAFIIACWGRLGFSM